MATRQTSQPVVEVVFSLDLTASMRSCLAQVQEHAQSMMRRLQRDIPGIRLAFIGHGDYPKAGQRGHKYTLKVENFTADVDKLCRFVSGLEETSGHDKPKCYELALKTMVDSLSRGSPGSRRVAVVIGDNVPHEPGDKRNQQNINWRAELRRLVSMDVKIHGVQCLDNSYAEDFYRTLAEESGGNYLRLREFDLIRDLMLAVCYREARVVSLEEILRRQLPGIEAFIMRAQLRWTGHVMRLGDSPLFVTKGYEQEVIRREEPLSSDLSAIFAALRH